MEERMGKAFAGTEQLTVGGRHLHAGDPAPDFLLAYLDLADLAVRTVGLADSAGMVRLLNVVNSLERTHRFLFDCGISTDGMVENMRRLDIDPGEMGAVVLSHGHWDHITGLDGLAQRLGRPQYLPIVLHPESFTQRRMAVPGKEPFDLPVLSRTARGPDIFTPPESPLRKYFVDR